MEERGDPAPLGIVAQVDLIGGAQPVDWKADLIVDRLPGLGHRDPLPNVHVAAEWSGGGRGGWGRRLGHPDPDSAQAEEIGHGLAGGGGEGQDRDRQQDRGRSRECKSPPELGRPSFEETTLRHAPGFDVAANPGGQFRRRWVVQREGQSPQLAFERLHIFSS